MLLEVCEDLAVALELIDALVGLDTSEKLDGELSGCNVGEVLLEIFVV
jgi:hypothetical protein